MNNNIIGNKFLIDEIKNRLKSSLSDLFCMFLLYVCYIYKEKLNEDSLFFFI